jgi:hypothetical protein
MNFDTESAEPPGVQPLVVVEADHLRPARDEYLRRRDAGACEPDDEGAGSSERRRRAQLPVNRRKSR